MPASCAAVTARAASGRGDPRARPAEELESDSALPSSRARPSTLKPWRRTARLDAARRARSAGASVAPLEHDLGAPFT